ncbi:MAG: hypothetical protein RBR91_10965, partial [Porticoccaceae bacterium]|nr:hypothetical protein [Porticoccaceae bacterium]
LRRTEQVEQNTKPGKTCLHYRRWRRVERCENPTSRTVLAQSKRTLREAVPYNPPIIMQMAPTMNFSFFLRHDP